MRNNIIIVLMLLGLTFLGTSVVLADLNDGLVAHYPFNGNANDESGNGNNGTVNGASLTTDRLGKANSAYSFDGVNDYIATNYSGILGKNPRTVSMWLKTTINNKIMYGLAYGGHASGRGNTFRCGLNFENLEGVDIDVSNGDILYDANVNDNTWHHYVWVVPNMEDPKLTDVKIYQDGQLLTTVTNHYRGESWSQQTVINTTQDVQNVHIGHFYGDETGFNFYHSGDIDEVRIYNRSLSSSEIVELYNYGGTPTAPTATTKSATNVKSTSATLNGTVNANGGTTTAWFEYGNASGTYSNTTSTQTISSGWSDTSVTADISGLSSKTTYYYRLVAQNSVGATYGSELSFATTAPPTVTTGSATNVTMISATLNGTVNANGTSTTAWFEYGKTSGAYDKTTTTQSVSGSSDTSVSIYISGLSSGTGYYYRLVAQNNAGVSYGSENSFSTITSSTPVPTPTPTSNNGLVAYYPFNGNANDESGNGNNGTVYGATLTTDRLGNANSAYSFDGVDNRIKIPDNVVSGTTITSNLWIKTQDNTYGLISGANATYHNEYLLYNTNVSGKFELYYHNLSDPGYTTNTIMPTDNQWHMVTVITKIDESVIFLDGVLKETVSYGCNSSLNVEGLWIGGDQDCVDGCWETYQQFEGSIDDMRIYNRALSASEIQELYSGTTPTPTPSPTTTPIPTPITSPAPTLPPLPTPQVSPSPSNEGIVLGFVYDEDENPMRDVTISIEGANYSESTETDGEGYYEFTGLAAGDYALTYEKEGYTTENRDVSLEGDETVVYVDDIFMEVIQKGSIYGYVVDIRGDALEKVKLKLKGVKTKVTKTASSDRDGFFEFEDLDPDTYRVALTKKFYKKVNKVVKLEEGEDKEIEIEMKKTSKRIKGLLLEEDVQ